MYPLIFTAWVLVTFFTAVGISRAQNPPLSACVQAATPKYDYLPLGRHVAFICTNATGTAVYPAGLSCLHSVCNPSAFAAAVVRVATAQDYKKAVDTEWAENVKWDCDAPPNEGAKALCAERRDWIASNWSTWIAEFKPATWKVKPNGTATTRPAYALVNGVLGTKEAGRATVGAACDVTKPTAPAIGGDVRAEYGVSGLVTICTKS